jgi:DNA polymerase I
MSDKPAMETPLAISDANVPSDHPAPSIDGSGVGPHADWLWGWDGTPGIVSVWAERDGRALVWRRLADGSLMCERDPFRPWALLSTLGDLRHMGDEVRATDAPEAATARIVCRELAGPGHLRWLVSASDGRMLEREILAGVLATTGRELARLGDLGGDEIVWLPPEEQYLVATGRTYFRDLAFDDLVRMQFDLETTGLDATRDHIFLIAVRSNRGLARVLDVRESGLTGAAAEADLIRRFAALVRQVDPDVIENHNLHGFDLPFLAERARRLGVPLALGRTGAPGLRQRTVGRGYGPWRGAGENEGERDRAVRYIIPGRELIDTLDAVRRYDFAARDLPGHGLKAVARHFGLAGPEREYVEGARVFATWQADPDRVRRYALDDVAEAAGLARLLGGAAFAMARMAPRRYERLADAGPATGILDPLLVRAYVRAGAALPAYTPHDGTQHNGAALYLFASGVAQRIIKADVSSLYPSLMRQYQIGPRSDRLGALVALVDGLVVQRLAAKDRARAAPPGSPERHTNEAISAAMKILVNSAYGYLGAVGLTRLADVAAANEVTARGRDLLAHLCRELAARGLTLLEADTDGVYCAAPAGWDESDERRAVAEVAATLPPLVRLEFEGRYAAMLSHEPKNYALLTYDGQVILRGVAFRSIKFERFGETFLRESVGCLLRNNIPGVQAAFLATAGALRRRDLPTADVASLSRLSKTPAQYYAARGTRREAPYEALLHAGRADWQRGDRIHLYRATGGQFALWDETQPDRRDYDIQHYVRLLRDTYAIRLARAFTPADFATLFAADDQPSLFAPPLDAIQPILTPLATPEEIA